MTQRREAAITVSQEMMTAAKKVEVTMTVARMFAPLRVTPIARVSLK